MTAHLNDMREVAPDTWIAHTLSPTGVLHESAGGEYRMDSELRRSHRVSFSTELLNPANPLLDESLGRRGCLVVMSPSVERIYGREIRAYAAARRVGVPTAFMVLNRSELSKTFEGVSEVCAAALAAGLHRRSPIVAFGGGVCSDIVGLAAALHHRGVPHIKIPTTLIGLVDAGIGTKNAVNHGGRKSALGSFHPPEHSLLDSGFLASLPKRHIRNGLAECIKLAAVADAELFLALQAHVSTLVASNFSLPATASALVVRRSVATMLSQLSENVFELGDLRRRVDFGHTFSPFIEAASGHSILHGEAVAMDVALSSQISAELGLLTQRDLDAILDLLTAAGLSLAWPAVAINELFGSLQSMVEHRDGDLHLVVPTAIGNCEYVGIDRIGARLLTKCLERLAERPAPVDLSAPGLQGTR